MGNQVRKSNEISTPRRIKPGTTPDAVENQMINLAMEQARKELEAGKASAQVVTHFLKLANDKEKMQLEKEILEVKKSLLEEKTKAIQSQQHMEEAYNNAIAAMKSYSTCV